MKPVPWPMVSLKELVADTQYGTSTKSNEVRQGQPILRMNNLTYEGRFDLTDIKWVELSSYESEKLTLRRGDLLFNRTNSRELVGKTGVWNGPDGFTFAGYLIRIRLREDQVLPEWVSGFMNSSRGKIALFHMAKPSINMANISATDLLRLQLPVAPLEHQRRVISQFEKADAIRCKRKETISLTEELLRSAFLEMFGDPVTNLKRWPVKRLDELADVNRGKFSPRPRNDPRFYGGAFPFIQTGDLRNATGYLRAWKQTLNEEGCSVSRGFKRGTVAVAIAANIGDTAIVDFNFYCPDSVVGVVGRAAFAANEYLEMVLRFFQPKLIAEAPETAQKNINLETLRPLLVPAPPLQLQRRFAEFYRQAYLLTTQTDRALLKTEELFAVLMQRAFEGQLSSTAGVC